MSGLTCTICPYYFELEDGKKHCMQDCEKGVFWLEERDARIRADVIDEFLKKDKECQQNNNECPYMFSDISCVECIAKKLEEKK